MKGRSADPSAAAAQRSSFIRKERRPFCNHFIHQRQRPEGGTLLRPPRGTKEKETRQRTNRWKKIKSVLHSEQEVDTIIPVLKNRQKRKITFAYSTFLSPLLCNQLLFWYFCPLLVLFFLLQIPLPWSLISLFSAECSLYKKRKRGDVFS